MKKRLTLGFNLGIVIILNLCFVSASLGISPAKIITDFEPGNKFFVEFQVRGAGSDQQLDVSAEGDFAEHVTFDKTSLVGREAFTVYVDLPSIAEKPGDNKLFIMVAENFTGEGGVAAKLKVGALILIRVPYPGRYAEIRSLGISEVNEQEPVEYSLVVDNFGSETVYVNSKVKVYSEDKILEVYDFDSKLISPKESATFNKVISEGYEDGVYLANAIIDYGEGEKNLSKTFQIGTLFVDVLNWSSEFIFGKINEFEIEVKSMWNNEISFVYAEVNITKKDEQVDFFKTPTIFLRKQESGFLKGFLNAENLKKGKYKAEINLFYDGESSQKIVDIQLKSPKEPINKIYLIGGGIIAFLILLIVYILFKRGRKK